MFSYFDNLQEPKNIIELIFHSVIIVCITTYSIFRIRSNLKNGGSWRHELKKSLERSENIEYKLDNHIEHSKNKYKDLEKGIKFQTDETKEKIKSLEQKFENLKPTVECIKRIDNNWNTYTMSEEWKKRSEISEKNKQNN